MTHATSIVYTAQYIWKMRLRCKRILC